MSEEWRPVAGWPHYEVSSEGRVRSFARRQVVIKAQGLTSHGYCCVTLYRITEQGPERKVGIPVHRLVGEAFLGPIPDGLETRHLNGDSTDARLSNLVYGTHAENVRDQVRHGTLAPLQKTHCPRGHAYDEKNTRLYQGRRYCRACHTARTTLRRRKARGLPVVDLATYFALKSAS